VIKIDKKQSRIIFMANGSSIIVYRTFSFLLFHVCPNIPYMCLEILSYDGHSRKEH